MFTEVQEVTEGSSIIGRICVIGLHSERPTVPSEGEKGEGSLPQVQDMDVVGRREVGEKSHVRSWPRVIRVLGCRFLRDFTLLCCIRFTIESPTVN